MAWIYLIPNLKWFEAEEDKFKTAPSKHTPYLSALRRSKDLLFNKINKQVVQN